MSETTVTDVTPPSADAAQPSKEPTVTVEALQDKLAAAEKDKLEAQEEAKRWKNRVKDENPPKEKKREDSETDYADWRIDNKSRISLVKDEYENELSELQELGAKPTLAIREKALRLAEEKVGVKTAKTSEPLPGPSVDRGGQREPTMTTTDHDFNIKPETKKKYAHLEDQW